MAGVSTRRIEALQLESEKLKEAAKVVRDGVAETLSYTAFPMAHWRRIRTNNGEAQVRGFKRVELKEVFGYVAAG